MDVKEAVAIAKSYLTEVYAEERIINLGLEEVEFDDASDRWNVTLGFSRPWDHPKRHALAAVQGLEKPSPKRSYKVIRINDGNGLVESLRGRFMNEDAI